MNNPTTGYYTYPLWHPMCPTCHLNFPRASSELAFATGLIKQRIADIFRGDHKGWAINITLTPDLDVTQTRDLLGGGTETIGYKLMPDEWISEFSMERDAYPLASGIIPAAPSPPLYAPTGDPENVYTPKQIPYLMVYDEEAPEVVWKLNRKVTTPDGVTDSDTDVSGLFGGGAITMGFGRSFEQGGNLVMIATSEIFCSTILPKLPPGGPGKPSTALRARLYAVLDLTVGRPGNEHLSGRDFDQEYYYGQKVTVPESSDPRVTYTEIDQAGPPLFGVPTRIVGYALNYDNSYSGGGSTITGTEDYSTFTWDITEIR